MSTTEEKLQALREKYDKAAPATGAAPAASAPAAVPAPAASGSAEKAVAELRAKYSAPQPAAAPQSQPVALLPNPLSAAHSQSSRMGLAPDTEPVKAGTDTFAGGRTSGGGGRSGGSEWEQVNSELISVHSQLLEAVGSATGSAEDTARVRALSEQYRALQERRDGIESEVPQYLKNIGYVAERGAAGVAGAVEGLHNAAVLSRDRRMDDALAAYGLDPEDVPRESYEANKARARAEAEEALTKSVTQDYVKSIESRYQPGETARVLGDVAQAVGGMAPSLALNAAVPGAGMALLFGSGVGQGAQEAYQNGATLEQADRFGTASAALEVGTELLFGGLGGLGKGLLDKLPQTLVTKITGTLGATKAAQVFKALADNKLVQALADSMGEGAEEAVSTLLTPYLERAIYNEDAENATAAEVAQSVILGAAVGGVFQGLDAAVGKVRGSELSNAVPNAINRLRDRMDGSRLPDGFFDVSLDESPVAEEVAFEDIRRDQSAQAESDPILDPLDIRKPVEAVSESDAGENKTASGVEAGKYRAELPQNVELPTVPIINLSLRDVAKRNNGVLPQTGSALRADTINRAKTRLGLDKNSAAYIPASNVMRNGEEYVLKITKASLNKMFNPSDGSEVPVEAVVIMDNLERIANNGVYFRSEGDRKGRDQIAGVDHLMTTVYIDNTPTLIDMRVRIVEQGKAKDSDNVLYYFTPEAVTVANKKGNGAAPAAERHALRGEASPFLDSTVPQAGAEVKAEDGFVEPPMFDREFVEPPVFKRVTPLPGGNVSESNTGAKESAPAANVQQRAVPAADAQQEPEDLAKIKDLWKRQKKAKAWLKDVEKRIELSEEDADRVKRLQAGHLRPEEIPDSVTTRPEVMEVYRAAADKAALDKELAAWNAARKQRLRDRADYFLKDAVNWKDKLSGVLYKRETLERNILDIVPDKALAKEMVAEYWDPVQKNEAAANTMRNDYRNRVRKLDLSRKVAEGNTVSEAYAVQFVGEAEDNIRVLKQKHSAKATRDGKTAQEWEAELAKLWAENPNLNQEKIRGAVKEFHKMYDELFELMNDVRVRNGYDLMDYRSGYFPHFSSAEEESLLDQMARGLGITPEVTSLPTTINGMTHAFKPGIRWFANAQHRTGFDTTYDAVEGFDKYIAGASDIIHHTDDVQRLRALAQQIRYRTGDESIRKQIDELRETPGLDEDERAEKIQELKDNGRYALGNFVVDLEEYTNTIANKRSRSDRDMEGDMGRASYNVMKAMQQRVAANMVAVNPGSWLTNLIALNQGGSVIDTRYMLAGMWDTLRGYNKEDGLKDRSTFLVNRKGSDPLVQTWQQTASSKLSKPMEYIDLFTAESLVRGRYLENLAGGMSESAAMDEADSFVGRVMAGRSKGSMPTLFNAKNPVTKLLTQFQLEQNNQFSFAFKDLPREAKEKAEKHLAVMLLKFALGSFLYNELYEELVGRRPAADPIGILNDTVGDLTGYELPNLIDLGVGAATGELPSFKTEKTSLGEAAGNLRTALVEELPFVGGLLGGGRLPISSALPNAGKIGTALDPTNGLDGKARAAAAWEGIKNPAAYLALPFGGGQVKKVAEGVTALAKGGSYKKDAEGNDKLQYPVYTDSLPETVWNAAKTLTFGKSSLETAQDWVESGFKTWDAGYTKAYQTMREAGMGERESYEILSAMRAAEKDAGKLGTLAEAKLDDATTQMLAGLVMGTELETDEGTKTAYGKLLDAEEDLGLTAAEYLAYYQKYGGKAVGQDKLREAYDLGVGAEEYLDYYAGKKEYDADGNDAYSTAELIASIEGSGMTGDARTGMYMLTFPKWTEAADEAGIGINVYIDYKLATTGLKGKENVLNAINRMKVSKGTKDKLYLSAGYGEKGLKDAPWN